MSQLALRMTQNRKKSRIQHILAALIFISILFVLFHLEFCRCVQITHRNNNNESSRISTQLNYEHEQPNETTLQNQSHSTPFAATTDKPVHFFVLLYVYMLKLLVSLHVVYLLEIYLLLNQKSFRAEQKHQSDQKRKWRVQRVCHSFWRSDSWRFAWSRPVRHRQENVPQRVGLDIRCQSMSTLNRFALYL